MIGAITQFKSARNASYKTVTSSAAHASSFEGLFGSSLQFASPIVQFCVRTLLLTMVYYVVQFDVDSKTSAVEEKKVLSRDGNRCEIRWSKTKTFMATIVGDGGKKYTATFCSVWLKIG